MSLQPKYMRITQMMIFKSEEKQHVNRRSDLEIERRNHENIEKFINPHHNWLQGIIISQQEQIVHQLEQRWAEHLNLENTGYNRSQAQNR